MQKLAAEKSLTGTRFWGKISGTSLDYYVAMADSSAEEDPPEGAEGKSGINKNAFYVCSFPGGSVRCEYYFPHTHCLAPPSRNREQNGRCFLQSPQAWSSWLARSSAS